MSSILAAGSTLDNLCYDVGPHRDGKAAASCRHPCVCPFAIVKAARGYISHPVKPHFASQNSANPFRLYYLPAL